MSSFTPARPSAQTILTTALTEVGGLAIGLGIGVLLGGRIHGTARRGAALGLLIAGIASTVPFVVDIVQHQANRTGSARNMRNRLESIRDGGGMGTGEHGYY